MFVAPRQFDLRVTVEGAPRYSVEQGACTASPRLSPAEAHNLFIGRYQPFQVAHRQGFAAGLGIYVLQCAIPGNGEKTLPAFAVKQLSTRRFQHMPAEMGLPGGNVVFCAFNNSYKIN
jgi:hypothetical protein